MIDTHRVSRVSKVGSSCRDDRSFLQASSSAHSFMSPFSYGHEDLSTHFSPTEDEFPH